MKQHAVERKRALWGILLLAASTLAQAGSHETQAPALVYSWPVNAGPLDPRGYAPNQMYAQAMVYEPLVRYTASGNVEPWLATSWQVSDDGKTYTFNLRDGVRFSNGTTFDAAAAKANLDAVLANSQRHRWMELVTTLDKVEAPERLTLRLVLKHPYYPTLMELAQVRPLRFGSPQAKPAQPAGTGPWMRAESRLGEFDRFVRNPGYWGPQPAYGEVMVKVIPDPNSRALALQAGEVELIQGAAGEITAGTFVRLREQGFATALSAPLATRTVAMNTGRGATRELAVRQAINEAVDKQTLIDKILYGLEPRADALFARNMPYADIDLQPYPYDPALAARALDDAGWILAPGASVRSKNGEVLAIELVFLGTSALQKSLAEVLQGELAKVGIHIDLRAVDEGALVRRQRDGDFGMIFADTWGAPYDPHSFVSSMRYAGHADYMAQRGLAIKDELDQRIGQVLASTDEQQRAEQYRFIFTTLHEQAVYLPISYLTAISVRRDTVDKVQFGSTLFDVPFETMTPGRER